ncbi:Neurogenic locus notch [Trichinella spiralis]|uniref:Neurogenic locus notch n=1 Tax=Trichinella spiralis TaxID=6334 RepID=A0ABR3KQ92_TRISP
MSDSHTLSPPEDFYRSDAKGHHREHPHSRQRLTEQSVEVVQPAAVVEEDGAVEESGGQEKKAAKSSSATITSGGGKGKAAAAVSSKPMQTTAVDKSSRGRKVVTDVVDVAGGRQSWSSAIEA